MSQENEKELEELESSDSEANEPTVEVVPETTQEPDDSSQDTMDVDVADMTVIKQKMDELTAQVAEYKDMALRAVAESDNIRKRAEKERREIIQFANKNLLMSMLGFMDNFERAVEHKPTDEQSSVDFYKGIQMIHKQFVTFLADNGVEAMDELNAEFDPNVHEAIGMEEDDKYEKEIVIEVYSNGYKMNGEVLRAPKVRIGKPKA